MGLLDLLKKISGDTTSQQEVKSGPKIKTDSMGVSGLGSADEAPQPSVYNRRIKVAGVTFKNPDGTSRQKILREIYQKKPPFDKKLDIEIEEFEYEGAPAYYVKVNGMCIGTVASDMAAFISSNKSRLLGISDFHVDYFTDEESEKPTRVYYARAKILVRSKK